MADREKIELLAEQFNDLRGILVALGDENRQHLILEMMKSGKCSGMRVGEITEKTNLSRPAVSHHLQILKSAGIVKMRREATKNYYYFDVDSRSLELLGETLANIKGIMSSLPDRSDNDD